MLIKPSHTNARSSLHASWDDVRIFVVVANLKSIRAAAEFLGTDAATVARRLGRLEESVGAELTLRDRKGVSLTPMGSAVLRAGEVMQRAGDDIFNPRPQDAGAQSIVSVAVTNLVGFFWMMRRLPKFRSDNPAIAADIQISLPHAPAAGDATLALQLELPDNPDLICTRVGRLHLGLFVSQAYLDKIGSPGACQDLSGHALVRSAYLRQDRAEVQIFAELARRGAHLALGSDTITMSHWAVAQGIGIGLLPTYVAALNDPKFVLVAPELRLSLDLWLSYPRWAKDRAAEAAAIAWLKSSFDPRRFPWFCDEFIAPADFGAASGD